MAAALAKANAASRSVNMLGGDWWNSYPVVVIGSKIGLDGSRSWRAGGSSVAGLDLYYILR